MTTARQSRAVTIALGVVIAADLAVAIVYRQWWLITVAAGLFVVLVATRNAP